MNDIEEDASSPTGDRIYCQTTEPEEDDLRLYDNRKQKSPTRRRLILGVVIALVILFSIATALVLRFAGTCACLHHNMHVYVVHEGGCVCVCARAWVYVHVRAVTMMPYCSP